MLTPVEVPVRVSVNACTPVGTGRWRVTWTLSNLLDESLQLEDAWLPHGRFRGDGHSSVDVVVQPRDEYALALPVSASEAPGTVVENAFLILRVRSTTRAWRVFARMRIVFEAAPRPLVEAVTAQRLLE